MTPLCCNCALPLIPTVTIGGVPQKFIHADTWKPECHFRDREQQVNAARKVADFKKLEAQLGNS